MNLRDYYSQSEAKNMLGFEHNQQIIRWRQKQPDVGVEYVCGKPYYSRHYLDEYLLNNYVLAGKMGQWEFEKRRWRTRRYNLDLNLWLPRCRALEYVDISESTLYNWRDAGVVEYKIVHEQFFFHKDSLKELYEKDQQSKEKEREQDGNGKLK